MFFTIDPTVKRLLAGCGVVVRMLAVAALDDG